MIEPIVIGFGGNVGSETAILGRFQRARDALAALGELRSAPLYRSASIGPEQPAFLNTAVRVHIAELQANELIATVRELESLLGRDRRGEPRWGPRTIDLDVLVWGARVIESPELCIPHPRLAERRFALAPVVELLGESFVIPGAGVAGELLRATAAQHVEELAASW